MRNLILVAVAALANLTFTQTASASGCSNDRDLYNLGKIARWVDANLCYPKKLTLIANPQTKADRQYNYFATRLNEYSAVFSPNAFADANFEFMFYAEHTKGALAQEDAREIDFTYTQRFECGPTLTIDSKIKVEGTTGLTGVCMSAAK